ncbi:MAG: thiamine pyrophosphate-binding protein [Burkholderiales bacterium]|nr:thiamine pyrophosphate-binding protein [Burkholderiales bacterium]
MSEFARLAEDIAGHGVRYVYGITGSGAILSVLDELEKRGVDPVRTYFEGSAAIMAATDGRLAGRSGVAYSIKGPGLANMVPGLAVASLDAWPMLALTEAYPRSAGPEKAHKRLDHVLLTGAVAKGARVLSQRGPDFRALAGWAESEVPGPVILELAGAEATEEPVPSPAHVRDQSEDLLTLLAASRRPVVIAGSLAVRRGWGSDLARLNMPVFCTAAAKGVVDERLEHAAGVYTGVGLELTAERCVLPQADLVLGLGLRPNELLSTRPFHCPAVNIDAAGPPGIEAFGFAARAADIDERIWELLRAKRWGLDPLQSCLQRLDQTLVRGFLPGAAFQVMEKCLGRDVQLVMDTGYFCTIGEHVWRASHVNGCLFSAQGRYMGTSVPMAIGAAMHDPSRTVVAVAGDGGIAMYLGEIRIAVERGLPILFVLMTDGRFGSVATRALKDGLTRTPIDIAHPSWQKVMEAFGLPAWHVRDASRLADAVAQWSKTRGPGYVEVEFQPEPYERMCEGIR